MLRGQTSGAGVVIQKGRDVQNVSVGAKVLLSYNFCGSCSQCASHCPAYCEKLLPLNFGGRRLDRSATVTLPGGKEVFANFFGQSSFARLAVVSKSSVVEVPEDTLLELFAPLGCGIQTGAGAVLNSLNVSPGSSVAVFGVGSVGLSAIMAAKMRGAQTIIAVDLQPSRLKLALDIGATHALVGSDSDVVQQIRNICQPHNGVAFALDCSGAVPVIENMIDSLATRGRAVSVGAPDPTKRASVNVFSHLTLGRQYVGCHQGDSIASEVQYPHVLLSFHSLSLTNAIR